MCYFITSEKMLFFSYGIRFKIIIINFLNSYIYYFKIYRIFIVYIHFLLYSKNDFFSTLFKFNKVVYR